MGLGGWLLAGWGLTSIGPNQLPFYSFHPFILILPSFPPSSLHSCSLYLCLIFPPSFNIPIHPSFSPLHCSLSSSHFKHSLYYYVVVFVELMFMVLISIDKGRARKWILWIAAVWPNSGVMFVCVYSSLHDVYSCCNWATVFRMDRHAWDCWKHSDLLPSS